MRDKVRKDSERSDETCSSQTTASTIVSDNFDGLLMSEKFTNAIENDNDKIDHDNSLKNRVVDLNLGSAEENKSTAANFNTFQEETNDHTFSDALKESGAKLCREKGIQEGTNESGNACCQRKHYKSNCPLCKCYSSGEIEPLLEQNDQSINNLNNGTTDQHERGSTELTAPISHAKTYPQNMNCDACFCGANNYEGRKQVANTEINLKAITENYYGLNRSYGRIKKIFLVMVILDLLLIISTLVVCLTRPGSSTWPTPTAPVDDTTGYNICFSCSDLDQDPYFSVETLRGVEPTDGHCCFKSITSVYFSLKQVFQNQIEDRMKTLNYSLNYLQKLMVNEEIGKRIFSMAYIIKRLLMPYTPREKTAVHLISKEGLPEEDSSMSGVFHKLRWKYDGDKTILKKANIWKGLNLQIQSEGYYFLYTRLHFKSTACYRDVTVNYSINRQRGSTSTYIHETKESCRNAGSSLEHNGVVEMVVHLTRYDEIFISVSKSDIKHLSTEAGAHMFGLFEL